MTVPAVGGETPVSDTGGRAGLPGPSVSWSGSLASLAFSRAGLAASSRLHLCACAQ